MTSHLFNATIQEDYSIEFPQDIREELNWKEGDTLIWEIQSDNSIIIRKQLSFFDIKEQAIKDYLEREEEYTTDPDQAYIV